MGPCAGRLFSCWGRLFRSSRVAGIPSRLRASQTRPLALREPEDAGAQARETAAQTVAVAAEQEGRAVAEAVAREERVAVEAVAAAAAAQRGVRALTAEDNASPCRAARRARCATTAATRACARAVSGLARPAPVRPRTPGATQGWARV